MAKLSIGEAEEASSLLGVPSAIVGEGIVMSGGDGLEGSTGGVLGGSARPDPTAGEEGGPGGAAVEHVHDWADHCVDTAANVAQEVPEQLGLGSSDQEQGQEKGGEGKGSHFQAGLSWRSVSQGERYQITVTAKNKLSPNLIEATP